MSVADTDFFSSVDSEETPHLRFPLIRKGYDPGQVEDYLASLLRQIDYLEKELREARADRDTAQRNYQKSREDAYRQVSTKMAELLRVADQHAEGLRVEAEQEANLRVAEAMHRAEEITREAEQEAVRNRRQGEQARRRAEAEADRILGGLKDSRSKLVAELQTTRQRLAEVVVRLGDVVSAASLENGESAPPEVARGSDDPDTQTDDLLGSLQGFDLVLPELVEAEEPGEAEPG